MVMELATSEDIIHGLCIPNYSLIKQLEQCTEITDLSVCWQGGSYGDGSVLDLSKCTSLINFRAVSFHYKVKFPNSLECVLDYAYTKYLPDFSQCTSLKSIERMSGENTGRTSADIKAMLDTMTVCKNLSRLNFMRVWGFENLSIFVSLSGLNNLKYISLGESSGALNSDLKKLDGIEYLSSLEEINVGNVANMENISALSELKNLKTITFENVNVVKIIPSLINSLSSLETVSFVNCKVTDISGLSGLNLTTLTLNDNNIYNLKALENMNTLKSLNLKNNAIYDTFSYRNDLGDTVTENNIEILANLRRNGVLETLKISGNSGIINYKPLTDLGYNLSKEVFE